MLKKFILLAVHTSITHGFVLPQIPKKHIHNNIKRHAEPPSELVKKLGNMNTQYGNEWTVTDLNSHLKMHDIESASLVVKDENIKGLFVLDNHYSTEMGGENLHAIKSVPELTQGILDSLNQYNINYDITDITSRSFLDVIPWPLQLVGTYLLASLIISFIFRMISMNQMNGMNNPVDSGTKGNFMNQLNIFSKKSNEVNTDEIEVTFSDVAGCDEAKLELEEVVDFLKNPTRYNEAGAKIPKGVLLEGPPGTGKTLLARAVAGEAGVPFFSASGSQFIEMFVGVGASRVRDLFNSAGESSPSVIFIDEIDAIGRQRGTGFAGGNDEREQTLNQILTNMDGFTKDTGIIVLGATNRADILDSALTRPGRFDRKVMVGLPDQTGREKIIDVHFKNKRVENSDYLKNIAVLTGGFSGADIANLANEAAILSVRYNETNITDRCLYDAYEKITIGLPVKDDKRSKDVLKLVSYHEIGHALIVGLFREMFDLQKITINSNKNGAGGYTLFTPKDEYNSFPTKRFMLANMIVAMGGRAAEVIIFGGSWDKKNLNYNSKLVFPDINNLDVTTGASNDLKQANSIARKYISLFGLGKNIGLYDSGDTSQPFLGRQLATDGNKISEYTKQEIDKEIEDLVVYSYEMAVHILMRNKKVFNELAERLVEEKNISGEQLYTYEIDYN
jgi:cell division protease FtsH